MARFRLDSMIQLARQMEFAPHDVRLTQINAAERLLHLIDPTKAYPVEFVIFRITGYRPKQAQTDLLTGIALQHDLGVLIEKISESLELRVQRISEPVLTIDDVCQRFNITSKTVQRWRRKGLPARRFSFPDGKRRVGFLLSSVEHFVCSHGEQVAAAANTAQLTSAERDLIIAMARRLALASRCCANEIARRIARRTNRSPLTVLHTIRKHDQEHPEQAILPHAAEEICEAVRDSIVKAFRHGVGPAALARRFSRPRSSIYRVILDERLARLARRKIRFFDDPLYHEPDATSIIQQLVSQDQLPASSEREALRVPSDLPPYLQDLYRTPLLSPALERALFLKLNYHKFQFVQARRRIDPERLRHRDLLLLEAHLARVIQTRNEIVRANLRLVVSIARKHLRPGVGLLELISDGNITLMRAVDGFDVHRGHRFSTYATLALMKGFARSVPQMLAAARAAVTGDQLLDQLPDRRDASSLAAFVGRDELRHLLGRLTDRERSILSAHYGLGDAGGPSTYEQLGRRLGLSKQRVRQIERAAFAKLRAAVRLPDRN